MSSDAPLGIVAGSGIDLSDLFDEVTRQDAFRDIPGIPTSSILGHEGNFIHGRSSERPVVLQCGRLHFYEGHDYASVTSSVDALKSHGVQTILFTNAAGGLLPEMAPGELVAIQAIHTWPYQRWLERPAHIPTDFTLPGCEYTGDYMWMHGPAYETRAEICALQQLGGSVVGMSTAPEVHRCHALGIKAGVVSCVTNNCCRPQVLTHGEVVETAREASSKLTTLIRQSLGYLAAQ